MEDQELAPDEIEATKLAAEKTRLEIENGALR